MDVVYGESIVIACLRETLCDLAKDTFITRTVADQIFFLGCWALRRVLTREALDYPNIGISGRLAMYRFRKNVWTLYVDKGVLDIWYPASYVTLATPCSAYRLHFENPIKIIAVDFLVQVFTTKPSVELPSMDVFKVGGGGGKQLSQFIWSLDR